MGNKWKSRDVVEIWWVELSAQSSEEPFASPKRRSGGPVNINSSKRGRKSDLLVGELLLRPRMERRWSGPGKLD